MLTQPMRLIFRDRDCSKSPLKLPIMSTDHAPAVLMEVLPMRNRRWTREWVTPSLVWLQLTAQTAVATFVVWVFLVIFL